MNKRSKDVHSMINCMNSTNLSQKGNFLSREYIFPIEPPDSAASQSEMPQKMRDTESFSIEASLRGPQRGQ